MSLPKKQAFFYINHQFLTDPAKGNTVLNLGDSEQETEGVNLAQE